mmetsp:Transcript_13554/g.36404  ORF Transcript_13554/g.36404 Transcript_13554/m.36404 type:complete len:231 (-) Transcript_13554:497-1189(-)
MHKLPNMTVRDDCLDLIAVAGSNVANRPARFFPNALFDRGQAVSQRTQRASVNHGLRLLVISCHNVTQCAKNRRLYADRRPTQQKHQSRNHSGVDHDLNVFVRAIRQVGKRPARVGEHFLVLQLNKPRQRRQTVAHNVEVWLRLTATQVRKRPRGVAQQRGARDCVYASKQTQHRRKRTVVQQKVAARRRVSGDVSERPYSLLANLFVRCAQQADENGDSACVHHDCGVL